MDKMREQFEEHAYCWAASFTRSEEEYCDDEVNSAWLYFKAGAAWQAAQSAAVPVVGDVVAWLVDKPLRHVNMGKSTPIGIGNATQEPLYRAPATSITAAELDALRKDAERYRWLRDGNDNKKSAACHIAVNCYGLEWDDAIDAAIAQGSGGQSTAQGCAKVCTNCDTALPEGCGGIFRGEGAHCELNSQSNPVAEALAQGKGE